MRRSIVNAIVLLVIASVGVSGAAAAPAHSRGPDGYWAATQIESVVSAGLMGPDVAAFRPDEPLTADELRSALAVLGTAVAETGTGEVTLAELDAALVSALGLSESAQHFQAGLAAAGLKPPAYAGTEIVARLAGLRFDHPQADDAIELQPDDPATRAEAAYSLARVLQLEDEGWRIASIQSQASSFALPELTPWQRRLLTVAVSLIGYPYVWAGTSEEPQEPLGVPASGGFDCSGFVWRVFKLERYPDAPKLGLTIKGRTTYAMSAEVPVGARISFETLQPADLFFSGDAGPKSKPAQIGHMGIYLGNGWLIHSSGKGVTVVPVGDYYRQRFAWGRRPLAEAGLPLE